MNTHTSDTLPAPSPNDNGGTDTTQTPCAPQGLQSGAHTNSKTGQKTSSPSTDKTDTRLKEEDDCAMDTKTELRPTEQDRHGSGVSTDNPRIIVDKDTTAPPPAPNGEGPPQPPSPTDDGHLRVQGWRDSPHRAHHQHGGDAALGGPGDGAEDWRSCCYTEDETSDWETPVDVELEVLPAGLCQKPNKASWSTVKAVAKLLPMSRSSVPWSQLAGHKGSFLGGPGGTVLKARDTCEERNLGKLREEGGQLYTLSVPTFHGTVKKDGKDYVQMQDLQSRFASPSVMDVKMGLRTYMEKELEKALKEPTLRKDLYEKMVSVDPEAPSPEEREMGAITKTRYLRFRDDMSSTSSLGFRIEGIKTSAIASKDFKKTRTPEDVQKALNDFVGNNTDALEKYITLLQDLKKQQESSQFFRSHEMVGSSLLFLHDSGGKAGLWMIDFAKCSPLPAKVSVDHSSPWLPGANYEDGYWLGLNNLTSIFQKIAASKQQGPK
ncbi:inositol-trisphosphate 3-kinase A-like [Babylonia areolata]|uniref:inositol-trisphosphate 3-kinase A-like n=1 Tax=Babylonia areolata TaxID=304850 RepID=UPI003FCFE16C